MIQCTKLVKLSENQDFKLGSYIFEHNKNTFKPISRQFYCLVVQIKIPELKFGIFSFNTPKNKGELRQYDGSVLIYPVIYILKSHSIFILLLYLHTMILLSHTISA